MQRAEATLLANQQMNQLIQQSSVARLTPQSNTAGRITGVNATYEMNWLTVNKSSASPSTYQI